jgi:two-component system chemotaxis response regulator CheY
MNEPSGCLPAHPLYHRHQANTFSNPHTETTSSIMNKTILVVDDSFSMRHALGIALKNSGYDVVEAEDGRDGLAKCNGRKFNLIISDVNMPHMDGISFVKAVKALAAYRFTPVIMLTTESDKEKVTQGKEAGARAWILKPFQPAVLLEAVSKLLMQ